MELEEEPKDVIVLNAISRGKDNESKIAKHTGLTLFNIASVVERLILRGLIVREEKKGLFGKKSKLKITEKGFKELSERRYELEQKWQKMVMLAREGKNEELERYTQNNRSWIWPMMMFGIIDMMMWMSMLSMMGLAMNQFVPDNVNSADEFANPDGSNDVNSGDFGDLGDISF